MFVSKDNYLFQWILDIALRDSRSGNIRFACLTVCPTLLDDVHHNDNNIRVEYCKQIIHTLTSPI